MSRRERGRKRKGVVVRGRWRQLLAMKKEE